MCVGTFCNSVAGRPAVFCGAYLLHPARCLLAAHHCLLLLLLVLVERTSCTDWCATLRPNPHQHTARLFATFLPTIGPLQILAPTNLPAAPPPSLKA